MMLKHKFSLRETLLVVLAAMLGLGIFYYQFVYKEYQNALKQYDNTTIEDQTTILLAKANKMQVMQNYIDQHEDETTGEVACYNNLANEIDALATILNETSSNVSINWSEPYLTDTIVRRNADISFHVSSYQEAKNIIQNIANLQYKCVISSLSISGTNTTNIDTTDDVTVSMQVTFFETIDGAENINGLVIDRSNAE